MAIKAGRVGVAPSQVDEFGVIKGGSGPSGDSYTKAESDAKFETISGAAATYETKADAANLQPKTLTVPTHMLGGTQLTVEAALAGADTAIGLLQLKTLTVPTHMLGGTQLTVETALAGADTALGSLQFRDNSGTPQVKVPGGSWQDFNGGAAEVLGFNIPADKIITTGITPRSTGTIVAGGYYVDPSTDILYVDITYKDSATSASGSYITLPVDRDFVTAGYVGVASDYISSNAGSYGFYFNRVTGGIAIGKSSIGISPANTEVRMYGQVKLKSA